MPKKEIIEGQQREEKIIEMCDRVINDLKVNREEQGLTTYKLSEVTGMQQGNITRLETGGGSIPNLKTIANIALALGLEIKLVPKEGAK